MKYIRIKNNGLIEAQALHLVGASTKRNDHTKIGQFGSGNKYALAYLLRNGYEVKVFAGQKEITIETKTENFRNQEFNVIHIDGQKTSITIEMGKDWQFWQAIREIYCNALDEGGCSMDFVQTIQPCDDQTHFYIDTKKDVLEFVGKFDNYFAHNKKVLFECSQGRILEKSGAECNIYRKGIRCMETNKLSMFDYDFNEISIDENRLVRYYWEVEENIWDLIYRCENEEVIMQILHNVSHTENMEGSISDISSINSSHISEVFKKCLNSINIAPKGFAGLLKPDELHNHVIIPTKLFQAVRGIVPDENVGDRFKVTNSGAFYRIVETSALQDQTIKKALYFLSEAQFEIPFEIIVAIFDEKQVLGYAHENKIILSDVGLERGINEVVATIIEEFIHLKYNVKDETRDFQDRIIIEFVSYMKKINSFVI